MPGDSIQMTIKLITPIAIEEGLRFAIREGGRTVGAGVVTGIFEPKIKVFGAAEMLQARPQTKQY